jgi:Fe2+ or Zn2+ uptake regulation protein
VEIYNRRLESIQDELVAQHGYKQVSHRLQILGICPNCLKKPGP